MQKTLQLEFFDSLIKEKEKLLNFWLENSIDHKNGGFYGELKVNNQPVPAANKALILNSRILWSFSNAYREDKNIKYKKMADRAYNYLLDNFEDKKRGGFYWLLDQNGQALQTKKQIYGQAFCIYAFSEYFRAFKKEAAINKAIEIFSLIEDKSYDSEYGGYFEAYSKDWSPVNDMSLSEKDMNVAKSMNTHLHILEAYTNLYRVWPDKKLEARLEELIKVMINKIVDSNNYQFKLFFDQDWSSKSDIISYGHDIEGSWLIFEAAEVLGNKALIDKTGVYAKKMAAVVLKEGINQDGSVIYEKEAQKIDSDRHWWPQAEAVVGFINAYQLSGSEKYLEAALKNWDYILNNLIDHQKGGWYWLVDHQGVASDKAKINPWKSPYHNSRACYEAINRIKTIRK